MARRRSPTGSAATVALLALCSIATACGSSGRDLRQPDEATPSPSRPTSTSTTLGTPSTQEQNQFAFATTAFRPGEAVPERYTCDGPSPDLDWVNVPVGAVELVLVVDDPNADGFVHWLVTGIPPQPGAVSEGAAPQGGVEQANDTGETGWFGPCPPEGDGPHQYDFTLYALPDPVVADPSLPPREQVRAIDEQFLAAKTSGRPGAAQSGFFGTYERD
ncbi:MAG: YbhB/YbcL family Raf kinase inhibitor-like protein [Acidimicrobiales bacterium]|jgi:hypothetical protein|nr:YbhB/YbcL family Raf kinase inhibitor-like protein [Acidimicrobiales bacterium]